ncbi:meiosis-specific protein ASY2-like [Arabidopsis lyrata subsp. lyrata]|uniref:meiosis-specific protein ASY2-like n=1 Tax=Arabidopsis lyrata subsp. lyrata TaxID=81972 RepID=UPI000A29BC8E|nr:meiosis-specific protein ASY2-like [Arabidopsis lyrata subsp. lyrata]|eukprot:XP_020866139.1 meiosis-specific protein ASY2-like [Arabidopsis lyrata subsp. lyrata]
MSSPAVYISDNEDDSQGIPVPRGDKVFTQRVDKFGPHIRSQSTHASLSALRRLCNIPQEIEFSLPRPNESPEVVREGYCCAYEVYFKGCGLFFPIPEVLLLYLHLWIAFPQMAPNFLRYFLSTLTVSAEAGFSLTTSELLGLFRARDFAAAGMFSMNPIFDRKLIDGMPLNDGPWRKYWFFFRINPHSVKGLSGLLLPNWSSKLGNQTIPRPTVDFLSFFRIVSEGETNWNSFTLQRIHKAGLAIEDGQTHPLDPPSEEKDASSLNARDKRKMLAETKALKDQLSEIGKKKRIAAISRVGNFHRKTLLVDDGSLEAAFSIVVDSHGADIPNDPPVATAMCPSAQE